MRYSHLLHRLAALGALLALLLALPAAIVAAAEGKATLDIRPSQGGRFLALTLEPGSAQELSVDLGNYGDAPAQATTYAADIYSLVNGGMGVRLEGEPPSGTTLWLDYTPQSLTIEPRTAQRRSFLLRVPSDAQPGEYLTSIVLQGGALALGGGEGGVALNQVTRQAMAIAITVPGPKQPQVEVGAASHRVVSDTSFAVIELRNSGNVRVKLQGELVLHDGTGFEISRAPVEMGSLYAGTSTTLEVPFAGVLPVGEYYVDLELADQERGVTLNEQDLPLQVLPAPAATAAPAPTPRGPAELNLPAPAAGAQPAAEPALPAMPWPLLAFAALLAALAPLLLRRRRR